MRKYKLLNYIPTLLFAIVILFLSIMPTDNQNPPVFYFKGMDKVIHAFMYGIFSILLLNDYLRRNESDVKKILILASLTLLYSVSMEFIQLFLIESRAGEFMDILANLTGIILGTIIITLYRKTKS